MLLGQVRTLASVDPFMISGPLVCYFRAYDNNFGIKEKFTKYLKKSCCFASDQHFSIIRKTTKSTACSLARLVSLRSIVCFFHAFENNFGIKQKFTKYVKESCCFASDQHFSIIRKTTKSTVCSFARSEHWLQFEPYTIRDPLKSIVCYCHAFENNFGMKRRFPRYLKDSCC